MKLYAIVVCLLVTALPSFGQGANGTITGTVTDPTGAVIGDAQVVVRNDATGQVYNTVSTATGNYTVPQLPVGAYGLTVTLSGFKTYNRVGLALSATQTMRIDVVLEVGATTDSVTVTAEASLLKTETGDLVHNVTVSQMTNLPILTVGGTGTGASSGFRDPFALAAMIPGIQYQPNLTMVVNGNPDDTVQFRVEGQTAGNTGGLRQYTGQAQPSVDAIQEVAVQTSNYAAEFGTAGGGIFNVTMKSGTNQYHGSAYTYGANEALNASQPYTGLRTATKRYDYGFTVGGPVSIPKLYDGRNRTFFFWSWEQFREKLMVSTLNTYPTVPTEAYRNGDFGTLFTANNNRLLLEACTGTQTVNPRTGQPCLVQTTGTARTSNYIDPLGNTVKDGTLYDPLTTRDVICVANASCTAGQPISYRDFFPGNAIPATRFDPVSMRVLNLVPLPEGPNAGRGQLGQNFQRAWPSKRTSEIPSLKIDQNIGAKGRLSGYWNDTGTTSQYSFPNGNMEGFPEPVTVARGTFIYSRTIRANYTHTITPTMLLTIGAGWNSLNFDDHAPVTDYDAFKELGLRGASMNRTFPVMTTGSSLALGGMSTLGPGAQGNQFERRPSGVANLSWVRGNHSLKFGAEYRLEKYPNRGYTNVSGNYSFGTAYTLLPSIQAASLNLAQGTTGFAFASFLMGGLTGATLTQPLAVATSKSQTAIFIQDTWKVTRSFTLDYGVRWDYGTYAKEQYGRFANFNPSVANPAAGGHPGGQIYEAVCKCNFARNYPYAIGPRIGFSYQINNKTVLRGGFGVVYSATGIASGSATNDASGGNAGLGNILGRFQDGMPANVQPIFPNFNVDAGQPVGAVVGAPQYLDPNAGRPARQWQWSIGLQRELTRDLIVEATYVANRGVWWPAGLSQFQAVSEQMIGRYGFSVTNPADGTLLAKQIGQLTAADRSVLAARGVGEPYPGYFTNPLSTGQTVRQTLVPFPQYTGSITPSQSPLGNTWYDSLQMNVTKRFSHGLSFNVNYTFSKTLDLNSSPDIFNRQMGKDLAGTDLPQQFRLTAEYTTPRTLNSGIPFLSNSVVSYILSDWGIGGYMSYQSAAVLGRPGNNGSQPISQWLGRGPGGAQWNGESLWNTNWTDYDGKVHNTPIDINCHCFDPTKTIVLNPGAWENIPNGQWGAQQTTIRDYRGFRYPQENMNLSRNFRFGPEGRYVFHMRIEFQNVTNRTRLPQPSTGGNFNNAPVRFSSGANAGLYQSGFGTIVPVAGTNGARTGTFIGRLTF